MDQSPRSLSAPFGLMQTPSCSKCVTKTDPPMKIEEYISKCVEGVYLGSESIEAMRTKGIYHHFTHGSFQVLTALCGWNKRWNHWGGRGTLYNSLEAPM